MPCRAPYSLRCLPCFCSKVYDDWQEAWEARLSEDACEGAGLMRSCLGDCIEATVGESCHWNPELACPMSDCDEDVVSIVMVLLSSTWRLGRGGGGGGDGYVDSSSGNTGSGLLLCVTSKYVSSADVGVSCWLPRMFTSFFLCVAGGVSPLSVLLLVAFSLSRLTDYPLHFHVFRLFFEPLFDPSPPRPNVPPCFRTQLFSFPAPPVVSGCQSCDEYTGYEFPCFEDPVEELPAASGVAPDAKLAFFDM